MPIVPTYDNFQASPTGQPNARFNAPEMPDYAGQQAKQLGQGLSAVGDAVGKYAMDMAQQVNETRVMDAVNKAKERMFDLTYNKDTGYAMQKGINALERPDGMDLATEYGQKFKKELDDIGGSLGNDMQRQAFARHAGQMSTDMYGSAERHMAQEFTTYQGSVFDGAVGNAQRQIVVNYADVAKGGAIEQSVASIEAAVRGKARLSGLSQEFADTQVRKAVSNAHVLALATALEKNDVTFADGYLKKFGSQMDADDLLKMQGHITKEMDLRQADGVATRAVALITPRMFNNDGDRAFNILIGTESNGQQFGKDGKPLTSSAGAIGVAQVMPGTGPEAAKLAGLPWDEARYRNDPIYNRALGMAYFGQQLQDFDGNLAQAYAAYNAGPGATRKAITRANARPGGDWLTFLPAETQAYVAKNMREYSTGGGRFSTPTLADVHAQIRQDLGPDARPQVVQAALLRGTQQFEDLAKARTAQETESTANAMRELVANGGKYSELPPRVRAAIPPKEIDNVMNFGARIAKGDDTTNSALYLKLASDPAGLVKLSDNEFFALRSQLNEADFKHFSNERAARIEGKGANGPGELNTQAITDTLRDRLRSLKMDPSPKDGSAEAEQLGVVHRFVRDQVGEAQRVAGKKFNDVETAKFIDGLFVKNVTFKGFFGGASSQALLSLKSGDVPSDVRKALKADFAMAGVNNPTDADILGAYLRLKSRPAKQTTTGSW
jgi:soluble lytic murein transglycosylase